MHVHFTRDRGNVIIRNDVGLEVNYGELVTVQLPSGKEFVTDKFNLENRLTGELVYVAFDGQIHLPLLIEVRPASMTSGCWAVSQSEVADVAQELSELLQLEVRVQGLSRILARWENGKEVGQRSTVDDFYDGITPAQREATSF